MPNVKVRYTYVHVSTCSTWMFIAADELVVEYNARLKKLANDPSLSSHDFQVAYQPGFRHFPFSKYQRGYLSGFDW